MTLLHPPTPDTINHALSLLHQGQVISFGTETVYGLRADATNSDAVQQIFAAKQRPSNNPLIVHLADAKQISHYAVISNELEQTLINTYMPGPFTLLLHNRLIPDIVTAGQTTVGIRIPDHEIAHQILTRANIPLCAPSANRSGRPSPTTAQMVYEDMNGRIPLIIDCGSCQVGIESTVAQVITPATIVIHRPGAITREQIQSLVGDQIEVLYREEYLLQSTTQPIVSPWVAYRHYAPDCQVWLLDQRDGMTGHDRALLLPTALIPRYTHLRDQLTIYDRGQTSVDHAQRLYHTYYQADQDKITHLYVHDLGAEGLNRGIMNRVHKSIQRT